MSSSLVTYPDEGSTISFGGTALTLDSILGAGGEGRSYLASREDGNQLVLKLLPVKLGETPGSMCQSISSRLTIINSIFGWDTTAQVLGPFVVGVVGPYVPGNNLEEVIRTRGVYSEHDAIRFCDSIVRNFLGPIHEKNFVHRDIKPSNIVIDLEDVAHLIDYGTLRSEGTITVSTGVNGTLGYSRFSAKPTTGDDYFSLGRVLCYLLSGRHPEVMHVDRFLQGYHRDLVSELKVTGEFRDVILSMMNVNGDVAALRSKVLTFCEGYSKAKGVVVKKQVLSVPTSQTSMEVARNSPLRATTESQQMELYLDKVGAMYEKYFELRATGEYPTYWELLSYLNDIHEGKRRTKQGLLRQPDIQIPTIKEIIMGRTQFMLNSKFFLEYLDNAPRGNVTKSQEEAEKNGTYAGLMVGSGGLIIGAAGVPVMLLGEYYVGGISMIALGVAGGLSGGHQLFKRIRNKGYTDFYSTLQRHEQPYHGRHEVVLAELIENGGELQRVISDISLSHISSFSDRQKAQQSLEKFHSGVGKLCHLYSELFFVYTDRIIKLEKI